MFNERKETDDEKEDRIPNFYGESESTAKEMALAAIGVGRTIAVFNRLLKEKMTLLAGVEE